MEGFCGQGRVERARRSLWYPASNTALQWSLSTSQCSHPVQSPPTLHQVILCDQEYACHFWDYVIKEYNWVPSWILSVSTTCPMGNHLHVLRTLRQFCGKAQMARNQGLWPTVSERLRPPNNHMTELGTHPPALRLTPWLQLNCILMRNAEPDPLSWASPEFVNSETVRWLRFILNCSVWGYFVMQQ